MLSAPAAMPATIEVIFPAGFTPVEGIGGSVICTASATRSCSPVPSASRITGTRPAHDTRFSSSNRIPACRHDCDNLTPSASLTQRLWIFSESIVAGQGALSSQPRRRNERLFGGLRLSRSLSLGATGCIRARSQISTAMGTKLFATSEPNNLARPITTAAGLMS